MANLGFTFNPDTVEDRSSALAAGVYTAQIIEAEVKPTKAGTGTILKLTWQVADGPSERRRFWQSINIQNASAEAQRIGQSELKEITSALGLGPISTTDPLLFKPLIVSLGVKPDQNGVDQNVVKKVSAFGATAATRPATAPPPAEPPASGAFGQPKPAASASAPARGGTPWKKPAAA